MAYNQSHQPLVPTQIVDSLGRTSVRHKRDYAGPPPSGVKAIPKIGGVATKPPVARPAVDAASLEQYVDKSNLSKNPFSTASLRKELNSAIMSSLITEQIERARPRTVDTVKDYLRENNGTTQLTKTLRFVDMMTKVASTKGDKGAIYARSALIAIMKDPLPGEIETLTSHPNWVGTQTDTRDAINSFSNMYRSLATDRPAMIQNITQHIRAEARYQGAQGYGGYLNDRKYVHLVNLHATKREGRDLDELTGLMNAIGPENLTDAHKSTYF